MNDTSQKKNGDTNLTNLHDERVPSILGTAVPICVVARNVHYSVTSGRGKSRRVTNILKGIDFCVRPGELIGILGPSGSGKTTFLNALSQRLTTKSGQLSGEVFFNGVRDSQNVKYFSNYVMQRDHLLPYLTVDETLRMYAKFTLRRASAAQRNIRVNELIRDLSLETCRKTLVGDDMKKGLSGGQMKRLAIGIALLDNPSLLFLDEPTSGLDSSLAFDVLELLAELAHSGRTVICTLHQPRSQMFQLLDKIMLLSEGELVFQGTIKDSSLHFASMGHVCPDTFNPADFLLDMISPDASHFDNPECLPNKRISNHESEDAQLGIEHMGGPDPVTSQTAERTPDSRLSLSPDEIAKLPQRFTESVYRGDMNRAIETSLSGEEADTFAGSINDYVKLNKTTVCDSLRIMVTLLQREIINNYRNPMKGLPTVFINGAFGFVIGAIFFQLDSGGEDTNTILTNARNISGALFFFATNLSFGVFDALISFPHERVLMNREVANGWYSCFSFFIAKNIVETPFAVIPAFVQATVFYLMIGVVYSIKTVALFYLVQICTTFSAASLAYMISCAVPSAEIADIVGPVVTILFMIVSGFYVDDDSIAVWIAWLKHISVVRYAFFGFFNVIFAPGESWGDGAAALTSEEIIDTFNYGLTVWICVGAVVGLGVLFRIFAFFLLRSLYRRIGLES